MKRYLTIILSMALVVLFTGLSQAQSISSKTFSGLKFRNLGPAFTSGRIADFAIHPEDESIMYVAVGSGGVWKTTNAGTTWKPIFDNQPSFSIGCVTIDPNNPATVWVGTGENVGGRHVAYGDGIYVSHDEGRSWKNMGLKQSEHISKIIVHPTNPNVVWAASQGPLWSKGGERGVYKTTDGGKTWSRTLGDAEWVGATDMLIDRRNPDVLYAATWQRHRTVAAYMGGGPGSGIHRSDDGGVTWTKLTSGIPGSNLGKIGLAMSHFNPDVIYAAIETDRTKGGIYMSNNRGVSWTKQSNTVSGGTGPHYYQELYASPHHDGKLFLMNNYVMISDDHGKTFNRMNVRNMHVDAHAIAFRKSDSEYIIMGTDGGIYESFDLTKTWRFVRNLPITQYFKVAVDDSEPFYKIYAGTQDNGSHGGPSRTMYREGIRNQDWWKTLGADGHQSAIEPGNPDITYGEFQQGVLFRIDQTTGETVFIQPQPRKGEPYERFNWDAPILVSPHNPQRLYFASQRVWKSENRGDEWTPISADLTRNQDRITLPIMGKNQSWDNAWDVGAMSNYNTITSLAESPKQEGLLYAGTDDGIIQISEDGGASWQLIDVGNIKGVPKFAFINDIRADLFDANVVYAALDNHKYGDYKPYVIKSNNKGRSWTLINGDLPSPLLAWRLVQDHVKKEILFLAAENGIYFTNNGGINWVKLTGGIPTISFRDIAIQRREDDLVGASFGRGFFVLDDISPLRTFTIDMMKGNPTLFPVKNAHWYAQRSRVAGQGDSEYEAPNPPFGAVFTYYMPEKISSLKDVRVKKEKELTSQNASIPFPGWEAIEAESRQETPAILFTVRDVNGEVVNIVRGKNKSGFNRVAWGLNHAGRGGESLEARGGFGGGFMATPGKYTVTMSKVIDGVETDLGSPQEFEVVQLMEGAIKGATYAEIDAFRMKFEAFQQDLSATNNVLSMSQKKVAAMQRALGKAKQPSKELTKKLHDTNVALMNLDKAMNGDDTRSEIGERSNPTPRAAGRLGWQALGGTYGPTGNHIGAFNRAVEQLAELKMEVRKMSETVIPGLEAEVKAAGAPWIEGQGLIEN